MIWGWFSASANKPVIPLLKVWKFVDASHVNGLGIGGYPGVETMLYQR